MFKIEHILLSPNKVLLQKLDFHRWWRKITSRRRAHVGATGEDLYRDRGASLLDECQRASLEHREVRNGSIISAFSTTSARHHAKWRPGNISAADLGVYRTSCWRKSSENQEAYRCISSIAGRRSESGASAGGPISRQEWEARWNPRAWLWRTTTKDYQNFIACQANGSW